MTTRNNIAALLPALFFSLSGLTQSHKNLINHPDRYRLDLPKEWKRPKLIETITDILPETIGELKDRDFCTEGKAAYYVRLLIDSIVITNEQTSPPVEIGSIPHYTFSFDYSFYSALVVSDSLGKPVSMLRLISTSEILTYLQQFTTRPQNAVYRYETVYSNTGRAMGRRLVQEVPPVNMYVPRMNAASVLTFSFLLNICQQKLFEIRKILKGLNQE